MLQANSFSYSRKPEVGIDRIEENRPKDLDFGIRVTGQATQLMAIRLLMACGCNFSCVICLREKREREQWFLKNGARLLQEQISNCDGKVKPLQFFSLKELSKATNNFDKRLIVGSKYTWATYKGSYEGRTIAVRRSSCCREYNIDFVFNEIVMLSQLNHRNVIRILGGCFETATPMPVFEFICNGSLYQYIHEKDLLSRVSWEDRLRIATGVADALAYLHTESIVVGTYGSVDPDYCSTGQVTEKCDVYSYGVLLLELLTGKKAVEQRDTGEHGGFLLVDFAISSEKENQLHLIFESSILKDSNMEQLMACAELAIKCIRWKPNERPTMKEVAQELRQIKISS
ncbi:wall-associated receptor kinase 2-like protein [Cinnamomum micranthum f. kanehirae]|uniref:Wall-associated receptor kinase 2-like protein n=1 Tax=Cinnamomum micranthum f. kanehirae TaxID=337451 RepID=A0A443PSE4_9MAGN|nr:wall-associated receptor kinase 2-like protein [Cinnamomum micranthum f. kanehirae]